MAIFGMRPMVGPEAQPRIELRFDWTGFVVLAAGFSALQLVQDRGQKPYWFFLPEIIIEAVLAGLGLYLSIVHVFTDERPFLPPGLLKDRNFVCGVTMVFFTATAMLASSAVIAPYLESLAGYPVETAGLSMAPRGISMQIASPLSNLIDHREFVAAGLLTLGIARHWMSDWTPAVSQHEMMLTLMVQGFAIGFVFNPMTVTACTTLTPGLRGYATSLQGGRGVDHFTDAGTEPTDVARRHRLVGHAVRSRAVGQ
jgi:DHA2 family multidrug resistance protein